MKLLFLVVIALKVARPGLSLRTQRWRNAGDLEPSAAHNLMSRVVGVVIILGGLYGLAGGFTSGY